jgi:hypothetical protein
MDKIILLVLMTAIWAVTVALLCGHAVEQPIPCTSQDTPTYELAPKED